MIGARHDMMIEGLQEASVEEATVEEEGMMTGDRHRDMVIVVVTEEGLLSITIEALLLLAGDTIMALRHWHGNEVEEMVVGVMTGREGDHVVVVLIEGGVGTDSRLQVFLFGDNANDVDLVMLEPHAHDCHAK